MSRWRSAALERLPDLQKIITSAPNVMSLWTDLGLRFEDAYHEPRNDDLIERIYAYAQWCWHAPRHDHATHDPSTAVTIAFFEHIPTIPAAREDMPRWFTFDEVAAYKPLLVPAIGEAAFNNLLAHMQRHRYRYSRPSTLTGHA